MLRLVLPILGIALLTGCGRWAWEKPGQVTPAPEFLSDNCECLGQRVELDGSASRILQLHDCSLDYGRAVEDYHQCMQNKGYREVWKAGSP